MIPARLLWGAMCTHQPAADVDSVTAQPRDVVEHTSFGAVQVTTSGLLNPKHADAVDLGRDH